MKADLAKRRPNLVLPKAAWRKPWVIHCTAWGDGAEAVLRYLARYVFRVAITEGRIVRLDDDAVNQVLISSHRKLLSSKAMVVNVAEKPERDSGRHD